MWLKKAISLESIKTVGVKIARIEKKNRPTLSGWTIGQQCETESRPPDSCPCRSPRGIATTELDTLAKNPFAQLRTAFGWHRSSNASKRPSIGVGDPIHLRAPRLSSAWFPHDQKFPFHSILIRDFLLYIIKKIRLSSNTLRLLDNWSRRERAEVWNAIDIDDNDGSVDV